MADLILRLVCEKAAGSVLKYRDSLEWDEGHPKMRKTELIKGFGTLSMFYEALIETVLRNCRKHDLWNVFASGHGRE